MSSDPTDEPRSLRFEDWCIVITMAVYLSISLLISLLMNLYNRRVALVER